MPKASNSPPMAPRRKGALEDFSFRIRMMRDGLTTRAEDLRRLRLNRAEAAQGLDQMATAVEELREEFNKFFNVEG